MAGDISPVARLSQVNHNKCGTQQLLPDEKEMAFVFYYLLLAHSLFNWAFHEFSHLRSEGETERPPVFKMATIQAKYKT